MTGCHLQLVVHPDSSSCHLSAMLGTYIHIPEMGSYWKLQKKKKHRRINQFMKQAALLWFLCLTA
jgi:hypothetical protein